MPNATIYNKKNELANSLSHGMGVLFALISIPILLVYATKYGSIPAIVGASIYGATFLLLFSASTLYHSFGKPSIKRVLRKLDHISIYYLIAGTYTPFLLIYLFNNTGFVWLAIIWGMAFIGTVFKIIFGGRFNLISTMIYVFMGWMVLLFGRTFVSDLPMSVIALIVTGGAFYTVGVLFYLWERLPYNHTVWHVFVLVAGVCHYAAVYLII